MKNLLLLLTALSSFLFAYSQQNIIVLKKKNKTIAKFWKDDFIAFQLKNKQWQKGEIKKIQNDSFYIRPRVINYNLYGSDTAHYSIIGFSLSDIYVLPKKGLLIEYSDGRYQIIRSAGHVHWYWVKSGWLFRTLALGYTGLNLVNKTLDNDLSISNSKLGIAAAVFVSGVVLKKVYSPTLKMNKKYHVETFTISR
jgi:hypothetical protein